LGKTFSHKTAIFFLCDAKYDFHASIIQRGNLKASRFNGCENLINQTMRDVDPTRIGSCQVPDKLLKWRWIRVPVAGDASHIRLDRVDVRISRFKNERGKIDIASVPMQSRMTV